MTTAPPSLGVSIVICCHNSAQRLPPTLEHLKKQVVPAEIPWEVIVVDNASTDQTTQTALDLWDEFQGAPLRVVSEPTPGLSNARMKGFQEARYEYICLIDDDNWVAENWVETVYRIMSEHPEVGACGGRSEAVYEVEPPEWFHQFSGKMAVGEQAENEEDVTETRGWLWGAGLTIRKTAWEDLLTRNNKLLLSDRKGTKLTSGGDNEICIILKLLGWRLFYTPQLALKHYISRGRISWKYFCRLAADNGYTSIVMSRYSDFFNNNIPIGHSEYLQYWASKLFLLLRKIKWKSEKIHLIKYAGSREYLIYLAQKSKLLNWARLGPIGVYKIDHEIRKWKK